MRRELSGKPDYLHQGGDVIFSVCLSDEWTDIHMREKNEVWSRILYFSGIEGHTVSNRFSLRSRIYCGDVTDACVFTDWCERLQHQRV